MHLYMGARGTGAEHSDIEITAQANQLLQNIALKLKNNTSWEAGTRAWNEGNAKCIDEAKSKQPTDQRIPGI